MRDIVLIQQPREAPNYIGNVVEELKKWRSPESFEFEIFTSDSMPVSVISIEHRHHPIKQKIIRSGRKILT